MKKHRIVLASILKPVNETRMFEKIGTTLNETGEYEIFVIGQPSTQETSENRIHFLPLPAFKRISIKRIIAPWIVLKKLIKTKPDIIIACTHELLLVVLVYRLFNRVKIIYDVQENYYRNVRYTKAFPTLLRVPLAYWVRVKEKFAARFVDWFFLAEAGYQHELLFLKNKYTIIQNKFKKPKGFERKTRSTSTRLLFSGTLAESTGVFDAINLAIDLHNVDAKITLVIIGYCSQASTLEKIRNEITNLDFINFIGGDHPVAHAEIIKAIQDSDFGIIYYPHSPHTENSIPTKLYEYMGCQLPILLQDYKPWTNIALPYQACVPVDFGNIKAIEIFEKMTNTLFYTSIPTEVFWESEIPKLTASVTQVLHS